MTWRLAASTGCCVDVPVLDILDRLHQAGVTAVELGTPPRHFDPWSHDQVRQLGEGLRRLGIQPIAIHAPFGGLLDLSDPNPHHRHAAMGAILSAASAVREVGGSLVVVHATDVVRTPQNVDERLSCCAASLIVLARACEHMDVTLLVETPLPHLVGGHPDELAMLVHHLDRRVGVCFDTSHATLGHHWDRFAELVGDRLMHVHANDHRGQFDDHLPPGQGVIDWRHIRDTLVQLGFDGWVVLELACPAGPLADYMREALRRARQLIEWT
jgi:sugar phosphate isomerase/epimerase